MELPPLEELEIAQLGDSRYPSPLIGLERLAGETDRVLGITRTEQLQAYQESGTLVPSFEVAGPRERLFFEPGEVSCGLVTCGGLCPGLNEVIRSIVLALHHLYGTRRILGFRYGYDGLAAKPHEPPIELGPEEVGPLNLHGGSLLGTSRGPQDIGDMVETLRQKEIDILFVVGGDGTMRGAHAICEEIARRELEIAVIGVPKTIDNDLRWVERSFGFATAVDEARKVIAAAHSEALSVWNGVGLVKLMGRHSGFIAAYAALASGQANFCLVPEVEFRLGGENGLLKALETRLTTRHHAVIVVAEGAGQGLFERLPEDERLDVSGNVRLQDVGELLRHEIEEYLRHRNVPYDLKYIDPSYIIRSQRANTLDAGFCMRLGQHAVHAGMAGRTDMMVGLWNNRFTHVPLELITRGRRQLDPEGDVWQRVLGSTGQAPVLA
jgi:6-phosphofructokinase 1